MYSNVFMISRFFSSHCSLLLSVLRSLLVVCWDLTAGPHRVECSMSTGGTQSSGREEKAEIKKQRGKSRDKKAEIKKQREERTSHQPLSNERPQPPATHGLPVCSRRQSSSSSSLPGALLSSRTQDREEPAGTTLSPTSFSGLVRGVSLLP